MGKFVFCEKLYTFVGVMNEDLIYLSPKKDTLCVHRNKCRLYYLTGTGGDEIIMKTKI